MCLVRGPSCGQCWAQTSNLIEDLSGGSWMGSNFDLCGYLRGSGSLLRCQWGSKWWSIWDLSFGPGGGSSEDLPPGGLMGIKDGGPNTGGVQVGI